MAVRKFISLIVILTVLGECHGQYNGKLINGNFPGESNSDGMFIRRGQSAADHHNVTGTVYAVDENTLRIIGFSYDGDAAADAFFYIGTTNTPSDGGYIIPKAEGLGLEKLRAYTNQDLTITLDSSSGGPARLSDAKWISVWDRRASVSFADLAIPSGFTTPSQYSLGRLNGYAHQVTASEVTILNSKEIRFDGLTYDGRGPDAYFWADTVYPPRTSGTRVPQVGESVASKLREAWRTGVTRTVRLPGQMTVFDIDSIGLWCVLARQNFGDARVDVTAESGLIIPYLAGGESGFENCEELEADEYQVSWTINGDSILIGLASRQEFDNYMAFGPSGSDTMTTMVGSDVAVAYIDSETSQPMVNDYYLQSYALCVNNLGACPDTMSGSTANVTDDVTLAGYSTNNGITRISYRRPLIATDSFDRAIMTSGSQFISWALGPVNDEGLATRHVRNTPGSKQIDFGRSGSTCPEFQSRTDNTDFDAFEVDPIKALEDTEFRCDIGDSGGPKGYQGITGNVGWGIAWYINGNLIPEITVQRNRTYTFKVYGGLNPSDSASYHPFYLTTDPAGGYAQLSDSAKEIHNIIAGPVNGSYCIYELGSGMTVTGDSEITYEDYRATLRLNCPDGQGSPGTLVWTPDADTPNEVYYQCYTHRFLGWKIKVTDDANKCVLSLITMVTAIIIAILSMS